jgi:hypothetical protein
MINTRIHTVAWRTPGLGRKFTYCCSLASGLHNIAETLWGGYGAALRAYPYDDAVSRTVLITHKFASARLHSNGCPTAEKCITVTRIPGPPVVWTWGVTPTTHQTGVPQAPPAPPRAPPPPPRAAPAPPRAPPRPSLALSDSCCAPCEKWEKRREGRSGVGGTEKTKSCKTNQKRPGLQTSATLDSCADAAAAAWLSFFPSPGFWASSPLACPC